MQGPSASPVAITTKSPKPTVAQPPSKIDQYSDELRTMGRAPHLSLPFLMGVLLCVVVAVSATMYSLQKSTTEVTINKVTSSFGEQFFHTQSGAIRSYFYRLEGLMDYVRMTENKNLTQKRCNLTDPFDYKRCTARLYLNQLCNPHNITISGAKAIQFKPKFAELMIANQTESDRVGDFRGYTYGFELKDDPNLSGEWEGDQPGRQRHYAIDFTQPTILPRIYNSTFNWDYDFPENEPVAYLSQKIEGTGFSPTFIYDEVNTEDMEVLSGVFHSFWRDGRLDFYVNLQFSVTSIDEFLQSLKAEYPFSIALVERDSGYIIGDSSPDSPFFQSDGFFGIVNSTNGTQTYRDDRKVTRKSYAQSNDPRLRLGGAYVYSKIAKDKSENFPATKDVVNIGDEQCSITYGSIQVKNLNWLLFVVVPTAAARSEADKLNTRIAIIISVTFSLVCVVCFLMLLWVSRLMEKLTTDMGHVACLNLDTLDDNAVSRVKITELKRIQLSFLIMVEMLKEYRKYLPQALLDDSSDEESITSDESVSPLEPVSPVEVAGPRAGNYTVPNNDEQMKNEDARKEKTLSPKPSPRVQSLSRAQSFISSSVLTANRPSILWESADATALERSTSMTQRRSPRTDALHTPQNRLGESAEPSALGRSTSMSQRIGALNSSLQTSVQMSDNRRQSLSIKPPVERPKSASSSEARRESREKRAKDQTKKVQRSRFRVGLTLRRVTLMHVAFPKAHSLAQRNPSEAHAFGELVLPLIIQTAKLNEGVIMTAGINHVVVCWNGHKSVHNQEVKAVQCAIDIAAHLRFEASKEKLIEEALWTIYVASGESAVGTTGAGEHLAPVVLGEVTSLMTSIEHLCCYPRCILITDKAYDATVSHFNMKVVDVVCHTDGKKCNIYEVLQIVEKPSCSSDLSMYLKGFCALSSGHHDQAMEQFSLHMQMPDGRGLDPHTVRLYAMAKAKAKLGRKFGWYGGVPSTDPVLSLPPELYRRYKNALLESENDLAWSPALSPRNLVMPMSPANRLRVLVEEKRGMEISSSPRSAAFQQLNSGEGPKDLPSLSFQDLNDNTWKRSNKMLGKGAFGEVYLGMGTSGDLVAIKTIKIFKTPSDLPNNQSSPRSRSRQKSVANETPRHKGIENEALEEVLREVGLLSELRDENIVGYVSSCVLDQVLMIVMEYIPGGCLASLLKEFTVLALPAAQRYVRDIVRGLAFLHGNDVIHRDIKPHNVLLMIDGQCKLTDFGASARISELQEKGKIQGTPLYMAPEQAYGNIYPSSDVWSVGILTYQLLTGKIPYTEDKLKMNPLLFMYNLSKDETFNPTLGPELTSPVARAFCESILKRDHTQRPTAEELLNHPFLL